MTEYRRFHLSDLMAIVGAVAAGAAWTRMLDPDLMTTLMSSWSHPTRQSSIELINLTCPLVSTLSMTILVLRLRRPRPRRLKLARQPGFIACSVAVAHLVAGGILILAINFHKNILKHHSSIEDLWEILWIGIGFATAGAWVCLGLVCGWRPEPSWIDRTGRALGLFWLVFLFSYLYLCFAV